MSSLPFTHSFTLRDGGIHSASRHSTHRRPKLTSALVTPAKRRMMRYEREFISVARVDLIQSRPPLGGRLARMEPPMRMRMIMTSRPGEAVQLGQIGEVFERAFYDCFFLARRLSSRSSSLAETDSNFSTLSRISIESWFGWLDTRTNERRMWEPKETRTRKEANKQTKLYCLGERRRAKERLLARSLASWLIQFQWVGLNNDIISGPEFEPPPTWSRRASANPSFAKVKVKANDDQMKSSHSRARSVSISSSDQLWQIVLG